MTVWEPRLRFDPADFAGDRPLTEADREYALGVVSALLSFVPVLGTIKGVVEAVTGEDLLTRKEVSNLNRALNIILPSVGAVGNFAKASATLKAGVAQTAEVAAKLSDEARAAHTAAQAAYATGTVGDRAIATVRMLDATEAAAAALREASVTAFEGAILARPGELIEGLAKAADNLTDALGVAEALKHDVAAEDEAGFKGFRVDRDAATRMEAEFNVAEERDDQANGYDMRRDIQPAPEQPTTPLPNLADPAEDIVGGRWQPDQATETTVAAATADVPVADGQSGTDRPVADAPTVATPAPGTDGLGLADDDVTGSGTTTENEGAATDGLCVADDHEEGPVARPAEEGADAGVAVGDGEIDEEMEEQ